MVDSMISESLKFHKLKKSSIHASSKGPASYFHTNAEQFKVSIRHTKAQQ